MAHRGDQDYMDRTTITRLRPTALYLIALIALFFLAFLAGRVFRPEEAAPPARDPHGHQPTAAPQRPAGAYPAYRSEERR